MRLLTNENFPLLSVKLLRQAGYDVAAVIEKSPGIADTEVLAWATEDQRMIWTFDRDYGELIYRLKLPCPKGIVYLRFQPETPKEPAQLLLNLFQTTELQLEGWFTVFDREQIHQCPLP
jgi:predicted nuclease of predicted toxin-antitoxin system